MTGVPVLDRIDLYVDHWAGSRPDAEFLVDGGPQVTGRRLTWIDARVEIDRVAAALVAAGSTRGDRVAFLGDSRLDFFIHFLAATSIGCIWQGLNPKYTWDELAFVVADAAPRLIFDGTMVGDRTAERLAEQIDEVERTIVLDQPNWEAFLAAGGDVGTGDLGARQATVESSDPAMIVYTSGSTGRPKGALLTHRGVAYCGVTGGKARGLGGKKVICNLPVNHVGAVSDICARAMISGGTVVFQERFDPELMLATIETEEVQVWAGVPTIFQICLAHPTFPNVDLSCVEHVAWGGAAMSLPVLEALLAATGAGRASVGYGMTESTGAVTSTTPESTLEQLTTTVGVPIPGHDYRIVTEDGTPCKVGESGEIQIRGDWTMAGYWNRPDADCATDDGWFRTSDLAVLRDDGYIQLVGRLSEMFKSGGYNTYPREIEQCLEEHPAVRMAAVVAVPDQVFDQVGHGFVVADPGVTSDDLLAHCREHLANYKVPKAVHLREQLPMLAVGKIDKKALGSEASRLVGG